MNELELVQELFKDRIGVVILLIQTSHKIDIKAFQEADVQARLLARLFKEYALIPKAMLNELHVAAKILRAEAPYCKSDANTLVKMAEQLEMTFDLILRGECHDDRVPGVPRII